MKRLILWALALCCGVSSFAQVQQAWVARYTFSGTRNDAAKAVAVDNAGNVYVTGVSPGASGRSDFATVKYAPDGTQQWAARYDGTGNDDDEPTAIAVDAAGNVYVTGSTVSSGSTSDYATLKYSTNGTQLWVALYNGGANRNDKPRKIAVDGAGNVYVTGLSGNSAGDDFATIKYDATGDELWVARYDGIGLGTDGANDLAVDAAGNVYVTGGSAGITTLQDFATIKYDANGQLLWVRRYDGPGMLDDIAAAVAVDAAGNVFVTGLSQGLLSGPDYATLKYDPNGNQLWLARYNGPANGRDEPAALALDGLGNTYVTGAASNTVSGSDYGTVKYNSGGTQVWSFLSGLSGPDKATAIAVDLAGNVYVTGVATNNYRTVKYSAGGALLWATNYDNGALDEASAIAVDSGGNVLVTGRSGGATGEDFATVKYTQTGYPTITNQPQSQSVTSGATVTFTVGATGSGQLAYRWRFNGVSLANATNASLVLTNVKATNQGAFTVLVSDAVGAVLSAPATLTLLATPPVIVQQPQSQTVGLGGTALFEVGAVGSGPLFYQWRLNGTNLPGTPDYTLVITNAQPASEGGYSVVVSNAAGAVTSVVATLGVAKVQPAWLATYNGDANGDDVVKAMTVDAAGFVYVTGLSGSAKDYATAKYTPLGELIWVARYNGTGNNVDEPAAIAVDDSGNVYVTGRSTGSGTRYDYTTIKYSSTGTQLWVARYDGPSLHEDEPAALALDDGGNVYVTGASKGPDDKYDYATLKYDANGSLLWVARYDGPNTDEDRAAALAVDAVGFVYVTGKSKGNGSALDYATVKYAPNGAQVWVVRYNGTNNTEDEATDLRVDVAGNVYVTGESKGPGSDFDYATIKYSSAGSELWVSRYNGTANKADSAHALALDNQGNVLVTGASKGAGDRFDFLTIKYSNAGGQLWVARFDGLEVDNDTAEALAVDFAGNVYVTGSAIMSGSEPEIVTLKYSAQGQQLWLARTNGPANGADTPHALLVDAAGHLFVAGSWFSAGNYDEFVTIQYAQPGWPVITAPPTNSSVPTGSNAVFSAGAAGFAPVTFQWLFNGTNLPGATNGVLVIANAQTNNQGNYAVLVSNAVGAVLSGPARLGLLGQPPVITVAPSNLTVVAGAEAKFLVEAIGALPLLYQWRRQGTNLPGATNATLIIANAQAGDSAFYSVEVTNSAGAVVSTSASLVVLYPPAITAPPTNQTVAVGGTASFAVTATGSGPLAYQWRFNGSDLGGATNNPLVLSSVQSTNEGAYSVVVSNQAGRVASAAATLTLVYPPAIITEPAGQTLPIGGEVTFRVGAAGTPPLSYQWQFNGTNIAAATNDSLALFDVQPANAGNYSVRVTNSVGAVTSQVAVLTVLPPVVEAWSARYNGPFNNSDVGQAVVVDEMGNVYVTGYSVSNAGGTDVLTVKYSPAGTQLWTARYNGPGNGADYGNAIALDGAGNVYVAGESRGTNNNPDFVTLKYSPGGTPLWVARYNGPANGNDTAVRVVLDGAGNAFVLGTSSSDYVTIKYDTNGNQVWLARFDGPSGGSDLARDLVLDGAGNVHVTGRAQFPTNAQNFATLKYSPGGAPLWLRAYTGPANQQDDARAVALDSAGNVIIAGISPGTGTAQDIATVKYDPSGNEIWARRYTGSDSSRDEAYSVAADRAGNIYVGGVISSTTNGLDFGVLKYAPDGTPLWVATYGMMGADQAIAMTLDLAGNVYLTGSSSNAGNSNYVTVKFDAAGNLAWSIQKNESVVEQAQAITLDAGGNVIVTGFSRSATNSEDFLTVKYAQPGYPAIVMQPQDATVPLNGAAYFKVDATATPAPAYQWLRNGTNVPDATNYWLVFALAQATDAGDYTLLVSNRVGAVLSQPAALTVTGPSPAVVTQQPTNQNVALGGMAFLTAEFTGSGPFRLQWRHNGANVPAATNTTLVLSNLQFTDAGRYVLVIENALGATRTVPALVKVLLEDLPMTDNFDDQFLLTDTSGAGRADNAIATFEPGEPNHAGGPGGASLWISWEAPGDGIATFRTVGSSFDTLLAVYTGDSLLNLVETASDEDSGGFFNSAVSFNARFGEQYRVAVDGFGGATGTVVLAWDLAFTTDQVPEITLHPLSQTVAPGTNATFVVVAAGMNLSYQWLFNGAPLPDATTNELTITNVGPANVGLYSVLIGNGGIYAESRAAALQLNGTGNAVQNVQTFDKFLHVLTSGRFLRLGGGGGAGFAAGGGAARRKGGSAFAPSLGYSGSQVYNTYGSEAEEGEPAHCGVAGGASQWFGYYAEIAGKLYVNTDGSDFDTVLAIYLAGGYDFSSLSTVACDNNSGADGQDSAVCFDAVPGALYYIVVDGVGGAGGTVVLNFSLCTQSSLTALAPAPSGESRVRLTGQPGGKFQLQCTTNLVNWSVLYTTTADSGTFDWTHTGSTNLPRCFYRALTLPW